jgi:hypothetical protein
MSVRLDLLDDFCHLYYMGEGGTQPTVVFPQYEDEDKESLSEWQWLEIKRINRWVDEVRVALFFAGWHPAVDLPYVWDAQQKALVVSYELEEDEYSLSSVRYSYFSPRGWEQLLYKEEGFYPAVSIKDVNCDYSNSLSEFYGLDDFGFIKNPWGLLWNRDFDEYYPGVM